MPAPTAPTIAPPSRQGTPTRAPDDPRAARRVQEALRYAALRRLLLTTVAITAAACVATLIAHAELVDAERAFAVADPAPVSRFALAATRDDGGEVVARFWAGTPRAYDVVARVDDRTQLVRPAHGSITGEGLRRVSFREVEPGVFEVDGHGRWRHATFTEPCARTGAVGRDADGTMSSWQLCAETGRCLVAPQASGCFDGPLRVVAFFEAGRATPQEPGALWVVVERRMDDRTARMIAGTRSR